MENISVRQFSKRKLLIAGALALVVILSLWWWPRGERAGHTDGKTGAQTEHADEKTEGAQEVELSPEALAAAKIEFAEVAARGGAGQLRVTGSVEANQQQMQQVTPLVTGRVEKVQVALGDRVRAGTPLAMISSPQIAETHGKLHEAETRLELAERELQRVQKTENRAGIIAAKAKLGEAQAALNRTKKLIELGAGAGKDLIAAETAYTTAKAEYEFQSNISLNRELAQAQAEVATARVEVAHLRNGLRSLGADISEKEGGGVRHDTSVITLRAPISGTITERLINAGAGIEAGKPLFTVANISNLWVIANVPEAQVGSLRVGTPAEIRSAALSSGSISGRVNYIDPKLDEGTRTARVRVETANPGERLKVGMFIEVSFQAGAPGKDASSDLTVPEEAVQRAGERTIVFVPKEGEAGHFEAREAQAGAQASSYRVIREGLKAGERVVTNGSFTLKTQMMKGELGEHGH
ncbi:MAG: efflux RND transporter periplasmic adaptor subunit [Blastocatellia bacterium]